MAQPDRRRGHRLLGRLRGGLDPRRRADLLERFELDPTKTVIAETARHADGLARVPGVLDPQFSEGRVQFQVESDRLDDAIRHRSEHGIRSLVSHPPTLEEPFLSVRRRRRHARGVHTLGGVTIYEINTTVLVAVALMAIFLPVRHTRASRRPGARSLRTRCAGRPRAIAVVWGLLAFCVVAGWVGTVLDFPQWVTDISPYSHISAASSEPPAWGPLPALVLFTVASVTVGATKLAKRDIA